VARICAALYCFGRTRHGANTGWLKKNPWFDEELLPYLRERVARLLSD